MSGISKIPVDAKYPPLPRHLLLPLIMPPEPKEYLPAPRTPNVKPMFTLDPDSQ